jgi:hypothetical protein
MSYNSEPCTNFEIHLSTGVRTAGWTSFHDHLLRRFDLDNATRLSLRAIAPDHYQSAAGVGIATSLSILYEAFYF